MLTRRSMIGGFAAAATAMTLAPTRLRAAASTTADGPKLHGRLGHVFAVNSPIDKASQEFAALVEERSGGQITIDLFPNNQIGGDEALSRELSRGSLEFAFLNPGSLAGLDPLLDIHYLPYIATNFDEVDKIYYNENGILQRTLRDTLEKHRIKALSFFELEFRAVTNSRHAVTQLDDLKDLKLRVPGSAGIKGFFEAAGVQAVTMPMPELFTALQQGTVDGQDNGPSITYNSRLFETQKFMTLTNHVYAMGGVVVSQRTWNRLSSAQREMLKQTADEVTAKEIKYNREMNEVFLQKIIAANVAVTRLSPEQMKDFRDFGRSLWSGFENNYGEQRIAALRNELS